MIFLIGKVGIGKIMLMKEVMWIWGKYVVLFVFIGIVGFNVGG